MSNLTNVQAQWLWLSVAIVITTVIIAMDVWCFAGSGLRTTLSHCLKRGGSRYWSILFVITFWLGWLMGHIGTPTPME